jgi:uncharacterized RDD family membrane protein YckC
MPTHFYCARCNHEIIEGYTECPVCRASLVKESAVITKETAVSLEPLKEAAPSKYGGFWLRFIASLIDSVILTGIYYAIAISYTLAQKGNVSAMNPLLMLKEVIWWQIISFLITFLYFTIMESGGSMGTFGKMVMGLMVTDEKEQPISFPRAMARYFSKYISDLTLFIGYIMIGFTKKKQGLHDMIAGTLVVRR